LIEMTHTPRTHKVRTLAILTASRRREAVATSGTAQGAFSRLREKLPMIVDVRGAGNINDQGHSHVAAGQAIIRVNPENSGVSTATDTPLGTAHNLRTKIAKGVATADTLRSWAVVGLCPTTGSDALAPPVGAP